jgi:hypothetical protein
MGDNTRAGLTTELVGLKNILSFNLSTMKYLLICIAILSIAEARCQSDDAYTRYELLDPSSQSFRILFEVTSTEAGATNYYNTLRKGSTHKVDAVIDMATGQPLTWQIVSGVDAKKSGFANASADVDYLQVKLSRPVPSGGEYRLKIDKTYKDEKSYYATADGIVFERSLGVKRNAIVLPLGYELVKCNYPSQIAQEEDGRMRISFINNGPAEVPLRVEGRKSNSVTPLTAAVRKAEPAGPGEGRNKSKARLGFTFSERAYQTREIVYFLQQPETHAFRLYHDYTETRVGMDRYVNVVRPGSKASNPSAKNLDTGLALKVETLKGNDITQRKIDIGETVTLETEVVVIWYDPIKKGESMRLRIEETYTDANRYLLDGSELVFDRSLGRPYNTVILPQGWFLTSSVIPATVSLTSDGLIQLDYTNPAPDELDVLIKARKR